MFRSTCMFRLTRAPPPRCTLACIASACVGIKEHDARRSTLFARMDLFIVSLPYCGPNAIPFLQPVVNSVANAHCHVEPAPSGRFQDLARPTKARTTPFEAVRAPLRTHARGQGRAWRLV